MSGANATSILDRTTVWTFENLIGQAGARALFGGVETPGRIASTVMGDRLKRETGSP